MAQKCETPAGATAGARENVFPGRTDSFDVAPHRSEIQKNHLQTRFRMSEAVAATVAELAFAAPENWRVRA